MRTGREFKETTYPDDSLEFPTRAHIPYSLYINQGYDILDQNIPDVVISQVYTKYMYMTVHPQDQEVYTWYGIYI